jgi:NhaP-type Na+/H+ or K+/H+ antiporter
MTFLKILGLTLLNLLVASTAGLFFGIVGSLILKHARFMRQNSVCELLTIFAIPFLAYALIEAFHYAGIITLLVTSMILGSYGWYNISERSKIATSVTF